MPSKLNAVTILKQDHKKVREMLSELSDSTERAVRKRVDLLEQISTELKVHMMLEQEILYPAYREATEKRDDEKLFFEAREEHRAADMVLSDLQKADPGSLSFAGKAKVLKELVEHHIKEEEREMLPRARDLIGDEQLESLGERMQARRQELLSNGHARTGRRGDTGKELRERPRGRPASA